MTLTNLRRLILSSGSEDYCGLYEIIWNLRSHGSDESQAELARIASAEVYELVSAGLIELFRGNGESPDTTPLERGEALRLIGDPDVWEPGRFEDERVWYSNTAKGDQLYEGETRA